jgi:uncharacterized protein YjbJ (UPF0337 family)
MTDVKAIGQKVRGKAKQMQGDINQRRGGEHGAKGGLQKLVGKLDEVMADAKIKLDREKQSKRGNW